MSVATAQTGEANELRRLSRALQFETVSAYDSSGFDPVVYKNFITYLREVFPLPSPGIYRQWHRGPIPIHCQYSH